MEIPRVHWYYGNADKSIRKYVLSLAEKRSPYVIVDYDSAKYRYVVLYSSQGNDVYTGERTAIIHDIDSGKDEQRIRRLLMLFMPYVWEIQKVSGNNWCVKDIYITSTFSPKYIYEHMRRKPTPTYNLFADSLYDVRHLAKVIEMPF